MIIFLFLYHSNERPPLSSSPSGYHLSLLLFQSQIPIIPGQDHILIICSFLSLHLFLPRSSYCSPSQVPVFVFHSYERTQFLHLYVLHSCSFTVFTLIVSQVLECCIYFILFLSSWLHPFETDIGINQSFIFILFSQFHGSVQVLVC